MGWSSSSLLTASAQPWRVMKSMLWLSQPGTALRYRSAYPAATASAVVSHPALDSSRSEAYIYRNISWV